MAPLVILRNQASCQNLVDSTKIERIKHDSKSSHRKDKDEKKGKRKHKHERSHKHSHKRSSKKGEVVSSKKVSDESEQLERSGLTEELEGPQKDLGYLSDGSQNSKKRRRDNSPPQVESSFKAAPVAGKPLRIRLIFKRPKVDETLKQSVPVSSTSGAESLNTRENVAQASSVPVPKVFLPATSALALEQAIVPVPKVTVPSTSAVAVSQAVVTSSVPCLRVSEPEVNLPLTSSVAKVETKKSKKHRPSKEDRYNALFDNWDPPSLCLPALEIDSKDDSDDWLFGKRTQVKLDSRAAVQDLNTRSQNKVGEVPCWRRAQFLPEVGIYSLPYTVPF